MYRSHDMVGGGEVEGAGRRTAPIERRKRKKRGRDAKGTSRGDEVAGRRETRHETATERRARLHKASEWDLPGPRYSSYSLRTFVLVGRYDGEIESHTRATPVCISSRRTATRKMSGSSLIPAFLSWRVLLNLKTHHPVKEPLFVTLLLAKGDEERTGAARFT